MCTFTPLIIATEVYIITQNYIKIWPVFFKPPSWIWPKVYFDYSPTYWNAWCTSLYWILTKSVNASLSWQYYGPFFARGREEGELIAIYSRRNCAKFGELTSVCVGFQICCFISKSQLLRQNFAVYLPPPCKKL